MNVCGLFTPGLYAIINSITNKIYESTNILNRLGRHSDNLEGQRHDCLALQKDFNCYGKEAFIFQALRIGPVYANAKKRKTIEQRLISKLSKNKGKHCYHCLTRSTWHQTYQKVKINDKIYLSLREAARIVKELRTNITRKCRDRKNQNYNFITTELTKQETVQSKKSKPCSINGITYVSMAAAAKHTKQSSSTIRRRCLSKTNLNYCFV